MLTWQTDAYMAKTNAHLASHDALLQSQATSLQNLETQMGQVAQDVNFALWGLFLVTQSIIPRMATKSNAML